MKHGYFLERYGYGLWKETEERIVVEFIPSGEALIEATVLPKPKKRLDSSYIRKRVKRIIKNEDLCDDRSKSCREEFRRRFNEFLISRYF